MSSFIIVNIKKLNYREHNYVVHNYNAPPTALRRKWGIKLMEEKHKQGQGFMRTVSKASCEERQGMGKKKKSACMQSLCRSL